jgi:archaellum component FlaC
MSQTGETVTYSLAAVLSEIKDSIKEVNQKLGRIDERLTKIEIGQAKLTEKVEGMDKRLEKVESEQSGLVKDLSDLKGVKSLIIPITVAVITSVLTVFLRSLPSP